MVYGKYSESGAASGDMFSLGAHTIDYHGKRLAGNSTTAAPIFCLVHLLVPDGMCQDLFDECRAMAPIPVRPREIHSGSATA